MYELSLSIECIMDYDSLVNAFDKAREVLVEEFDPEHEMFLATGEKVKFRFEIADGGGRMDLRFDYNPEEKEPEEKKA